MYWPNCHCSEPRLHWPNRFGWSKPMKPPTPVPCPTDAPKFTLPVRFSFTWKIRSMSPLLVRRLRVRRRHGLLEEAEVADVLVAVDQRVAAEHVARQDEELVANARLRRDVVAEDVDAVHDRRRPLVDLPAEIDRRHRIRARLRGARRPGACSRRCSLRSRTPPAPCRVASSHARLVEVRPCRRCRGPRRSSPFTVAGDASSACRRTDRSARCPRSRSALRAVHLEVADLVPRSFVAP